MQISKMHKGEHETGLFECNSNEVFRVCFISKRSNSVAASQSINHIDLPKGSNAFLCNLL